jgi:hypothetical protein
MPEGLLRIDKSHTPEKWYVYTVFYNGIWSEAIELDNEEQKFCNKNFDLVNNEGKGTHVHYEAKMNQYTEYYATTNIKEIIEKPKDAVNHPNHYGGENNTYEVIKVCEAWGLDLDAYLFNVVKYVARAGKKDKKKEIEDLKKAEFYLRRKIQNLEK